MLEWPTRAALLTPLIVWLGGCVQPIDDDDDPIDERELADEPDRDDDASLGLAAPTSPAAPLAQEHVAPTLSSTWPTIAPDVDQIVHGGLPLLVRNDMDEPTRVELGLRIVGDGEELRVDLSDLELAAREARELDVVLPAAIVAELARVSFSAQLHVEMTIPGNPPLGPMLSDPLYVHVEGGRLLAYDEHGLTTRHRGGDLDGRVWTMVDDATRRDLVSISRARLERVADTADVPVPARTRGGKVVP